MPRKKNSSTPAESLPIDSPERRRLPLLLRRAWYGLNQAFRRRIAHTKVTPDQFTVMRTLIEGDPKGMSQRELTSQMSSDPNTVASLLERMEAGGLIQRKAHEADRRAHRIQLHPSAEKTYHAIREIALNLQVEVLGALPVEKRDEFLETLTLVADACRVASEASPKAKSSKASLKAVPE